MRTFETLEFIGGVLCLDFVNTINSRRESEYDYLQTYSNLTEWAVKVGILTTPRCNRLLNLAEQDTKTSENTLRNALMLRELLYQLFSKLARRSKPNPEDLGTFIGFYAEAISHSTFIKKGGSFVVAWPTDESLESVLWPILYSAGQLLLAKELIRIKGCPNCGWLFLDTSKNQSRRWCSMNTCGARDKMRRYLHRTRMK